MALEPRDAGQVGEPADDGDRVPELSPENEALFQESSGAGEVALLLRADGQSIQSDGDASPVIQLAVAAQGLLEKSPSDRRLPRQRRAPALAPGCASPLPGGSRAVPAVRAPRPGTRALPRTETARRPGEGPSPLPHARSANRAPPGSCRARPRPGRAIPICPRSAAVRDLAVRRIPCSSRKRYLPRRRRNRRHASASSGAPPRSTPAAPGHIHESFRA